MRLARALSLVVALAACGSEDPTAADAGPASVTIGTGQTAFEALTDGDDVPVIQGPQGGFHIFGAFHASGIDPGDPDDLSNPNNPTGEFRVFEGATRVDLAEANEFTQGLGAVAGGVGTVGRLVILDITDDAELDGVTVRFEVSVTDVHGKTASDQVTLDLFAFPGNP